MPSPDAADLLERVNTLPAEELAALLRQCVAVPRWAAELIAGRPYPDVGALLVRVAELTAGLSDTELLSALADHPRIGERPAAGSGSANWSAREQSGVDSRDASLAERLAAGNAEYERRFGHIYLVCATGKNGQDILADLHTRLANPPARELAVARRELGDIAQLRLPRVLFG
jgi:2-oxo-4-hydroxy-4-carboxy-5-ureidoimidazoline decarboxylase